MGDGYLIRDAVLEDVDQIVEVWAHAMEFHRTLDPMFERCADADSKFAAHVGGMIDDADRVVLVAESDAKVVGFTNGSIAQYPPVLARREHGFIGNLHVLPQHQRRGVGTALLRGAMAWFQSKGVSTMEARFHLANPKMTAFLKSTEFVPYLQVIRASVSPQA